MNTLYSIAREEKRQKQGCMAHLMELVVRDIHKMKRNNISYGINSISDGEDYFLKASVENPGDSGISPGLVAISMIGKMHMADKSFWRWKSSRELELEIAIFPKLIPKISFSEITGLFNHHEKDAKSCIETNESLRGAELKMVFHEEG